MKRLIFVLLFLATVVRVDAQPTGTASTDTAASVAAPVAAAPNDEAVHNALRELKRLRM